MDKNLVVAQIVDGKTLILNKGSREDIKVGQEYVVYKLGEKVIDPETGEDLGRWEIVRGRGEIIDVREKFSVLKSRNLSHALMAFSAALSGGSKFVPFDSPEEGDIAKLIEVKKDISK